MAITLFKKNNNQENNTPVEGEEKEQTKMSKIMNSKPVKVIKNVLKVAVPAAIGAGAVLLLTKDKGEDVEDYDDFEEDDADYEAPTED